MSEIKLKARIIIVLISLTLIFGLFIYTFDKVATPTIVAVSDAEMRARAMEIVNKVILDEYTKQFNYDDIIRIDKDNEGNIVLLKADTLKMNKIACDVSLESQKELSEFGDYGIKIPMAYIFRNNIIANWGPSITVKLQPVGSIETTYQSEFESAGINQTRHKIYVQFKTTIRVILPMKSNDLEVINEIPISETVIVGKIPNTAVQMDLDNAGFKLKNNQR